MIYIIHAATDGGIAAVLKSELERLTGLRVFVASKPGDIPTGADWLKEIQDNLRAAETFILLLTPRSVSRPWVWYESGVAWVSERRRLPVVAGGLEPGNIPYPLGAAQALALENPDHAEQLFRDCGTALDDSDSFVRRIRNAANAASRAADDGEGWSGVQHDDGFFAWSGPLAGLEDRQGVLPPRGLRGALRAAGMTETFGNIDRLEHHFRDGRMQVFQTDRRTWKRPIFHAPDGKSVLLVHVEDENRIALEALRRELEFNESNAERAGADQLGTAFALDTIQRVLTSGLAERLGRDIHDGVLRARGAMEQANRSIEARLHFRKGSDGWANATNDASNAIVATRRHLVALRELLRRHL